MRPQLDFLTGIWESPEVERSVYLIYGQATGYSMQTFKFLK